MNNDNKTSDAVQSTGLAGVAGSESSTHWLLEGQRKQDPARWDAIGGCNFSTEEEARNEEAEYRKYVAEATASGWLDFRVVRVISIREILPNNSGQTAATNATK